MAVINSPYVGIARGRLGEGVFSRVKGQTTLRGYNPSPANPRSAPQQSQRAQFSSAVKFFSRGVQNFFKFAFENKMEKESDYNAFMRLNSARGMYFGPEQNDTPEYPALGRFIMTRGSLTAPSYFYSESDAGFVADFAVRTTATEPETLGALSQILVQAGYQQGDIVTFCVIRTDAFSGSAAEPVVEWGNILEWDIRQFTIDVTSTADLETLGVSGVVQSTYLRVQFSGQTWDDQYIMAGCVTVSRPSASGLKVSSANLYLNHEADVAYLYGISDPWKLSVLQAWNTSQESILQGSRSVNNIINSPIKFAVNVNLPTQIVGDAKIMVVFNRPVTKDQIVAHLKLVDAAGEIISASAGVGANVANWDGGGQDLDAVGKFGDSNTQLTIENYGQDNSTINDILWT